MNRQAYFGVCLKCGDFALVLMPYLDFCESCYLKIVDDFIKLKEKQDYEKKLSKMRTLR